MNVYGIIGYPLGHSRSPLYFNEKFKREGIDAEYLSFEIENIRNLPDVFNRYTNLRGFNVTIPHKQSIMAYLDEISEEAQAIGAVNCVKVIPGTPKPHLIGYNTDVWGFRKALSDFIPNTVTAAIILGNGGAAKAVRYALRQLNIKAITVSRTPKQADEIGYGQLRQYIGSTPLIVNTTPLGTWPKTEECPAIPYDKLTQKHYLFDLVYNPEITSFIKCGESHGAHVCNGFGMWLGQAEKNWEIWNPRNLL